MNKTKWTKHNVQAKTAMVLLVALTGMSLGALADHEPSGEGALPAGTAISVALANPADGSVHEIPLGDASVAITADGSASIGEGTAVQDTTITLILDISGSMGSSAGGADCNGNGFADNRLTCQRSAVEHVVNAAVGPPTSSVDLMGLGTFATSGQVRDSDLGTAGSQALVDPATDGDSNTVPDIIQVTNGIPADGWTCYSCGLEIANQIVGDPVNDNSVNIVVFTSDGFNIQGGHVDDVALPNFGTNTIVRAFALGASSSVSCDASTSLGNLEAVAARTTHDTIAGSCQQVTDMSVLGAVISEAIGSTLDEVSLDAGQGAGFVVLDAGDIAGALPANGPATRSFSTFAGDYGPGTHTVCAQADGTDAGGSDAVTDCHSFLVAHAPDCSAAGPSAATLWPPNHKMKDVTVTGVMHPDGSGFDLTIDSIRQDEPVNAPGNGDGNTSPDGDGIGTNTASVRAERAGSGDGRVYHIGFSALDENGLGCSGTVTVAVPHDANAEAGDDGPLHDATVE